MIAAAITMRMMAIGATCGRTGRPNPGGAGGGGGTGGGGPAGALVEFIGGEPAGLEVLAQSGDGPVAVGVGHPQVAGPGGLGGGTHDLNATDRRGAGGPPRGGGSAD